MKKILLISNYVFHYRQKVYNYFADQFLKEGYEFHVLSNEFQNAGYEFRFVSHTEPASKTKYCSIIAELQPVAVIVFLHLKDKIQIPIIHYCNRKKIPVIFWNKGLSNRDPENPIKNFLYHYIHNRCDALITYTPDMKRNFQEKNYDKLFIGHNTVNCNEIDKKKYNKAAIKEKYGISEKKVVLYISRMRKSKRIDLLLDALESEKDVAVVAMGAGMTPELQARFDGTKHFYYLGQKYGDAGNEVWAMGDVFSVPVNVGLGINEAIFWGLPIVTMQGVQAPEIYYLKDGITGFIAKNYDDYQEKLNSLLNDEAVLIRMQTACQKEYAEEVDIRWMYSGFKQAIEYCVN